MNRIRAKSDQTRRLVYLSLLTAIVVIFQLLGQFIRFGAFSASLVLIPIVIGAAILGPMAGAWLGLVFGVTVLLSGDAAAFLTINFGATILVVLVKGTVAGFAAGLVYKLFEKLNRYFAVFVSAVVCPVVNTGIFLLGVWLFFVGGVAEWASAEGVSLVSYVFLILVGGNFIFEFILNIVFVPIILRVLNIKIKT